MSSHRKKGDYRQKRRENHAGGLSFRRLLHNLYQFFFSVGTMCVHVDCPITPALCISNRGAFVPNKQGSKETESDKITLRSGLPAGAGADAIP